MDIFTTQLTRVVPVRIKPEKLKVKALVKDASVGKLTEEHDHSIKEEVDVYIHAHEDDKPHQTNEQDHGEKRSNSDEQDDKPESPHLDIYV